MFVPQNPTVVYWSRRLGKGIKELLAGGRCGGGISPQNRCGSREGLVRSVKVGNEAVGMVAGGVR